MERIKETLHNRFSEPLPEFCKRRIIFWQDDECGYADGIADLQLEGVTVVVLDGSNNFSVKKLLSNDDLEGNYLVYCNTPCEDNRDDWLYDIKLYSEEFRADIHSQRMQEVGVQDSPSLRAVMKDYAKFFENKERVNKLNSFGRVYNNSTNLQIDIFGSICNVNSGDVKDVVVAVLCNSISEEDNSLLRDIDKFARIDKFWEMINKYVGYGYEKGKDNLKLLASHILITALSTTMKREHLKGLEVFLSEGYEQRCYSLVDEWMHSRQDNELYSICRKVEAELKIENRFGNIPVEDLLESECFPCINECILKHYFDEINEQVIKSDSIINTVEKRRTKKWFKRVKHYYEGILQIARMQEYKNRYAAGFHIVDADELWNLYANNLYKIDTCYRKFHLAFGRAIKESTVSLEDEYKNAADYMENLYKNWFLTEMTSSWNLASKQQLSDNGYISNVDKQLDFYSQQVKPMAERSITFVIVSDALRYEVARELTEYLDVNHRGKVDISSMQGVFPTITAFGMNALLPGSVHEFDNTRLFVDDIPSDSTENRIKILQANNKNTTAVQYNKFLSMKKDERQELIKGMEVVYIYHNAIDVVGEQLATEADVFDACEDAIVEIGNIVQTLIGLRASCNIVITADHGFLYTYKPLPESDKLSIANINRVEIADRRCVVASELVSNEFVLPIKMEINDAGNKYQGYTPYETVRFKTAGGERYVHGGTSLQEMVVPVVNFRSVRADSKEFRKQQEEYETRKAPIVLVETNRKITNNIFSLKFYQSEAVGIKVAAATYEVYLTDVADNKISDVQTIVADKTTDDEQDRQFKVTMNLKSQDYNSNDIYSLVIAEKGGDVIAREEFKIDIAFVNDFDF